MALGVVFAFAFVFFLLGRGLCKYLLHKKFRREGYVCGNNI